MNNYIILGYVIKALNNLKKEKAEIKTIICELYNVFDIYTEYDAKNYYISQNSV